MTNAQRRVVFCILYGVAHLVCGDRESRDGRYTVITFRKPYYFACGVVMVIERTGYRLDLYAPEAMRIENSSGYLCPVSPDSLATWLQWA